jgi:2-keto-4-pentenoate hydratase/2-oxohepta-3-ene-1,7-dioic acid hydratase in catechol pathway
MRTARCRSREPRVSSMRTWSASWLVDAADIPNPMDLTLRTYVNAELTQEGSTGT